MRSIPPYKKMTEYEKRDGCGFYLLVILLFILIALRSCAYKTYIQKKVLQVNGSLRPVEPKKQIDLMPGDTITVVTKERF